MEQLLKWERKTATVQMYSAARMRPANLMLGEEARRGVTNGMIPLLSVRNGQNHDPRVGWWLPGARRLGRGRE